MSFVAILQATRALRKGFESAIYFYGPGSLNCLATRGFPTTGDIGVPGRAEHQRLAEDVHRRGRQGLLLPVRPVAARRPRGGPDRRASSPPTRWTCRTPSSTTRARARSSTPPTSSEPTPGRTTHRRAVSIDTRVDIAIRGVRVAAPVHRQGGAGPSDDGHLIIDGANAAVPVNPDSPYQVRDGRLWLGEDDTGLRLGVVPPAQVLRPDHRGRGAVPSRSPCCTARTCWPRTVVQTCIRYARGRPVPVLRHRGVAARRAARSRPRPRPSWPRWPRPRCGWTGSRQMVMTTGTTAGPDRGARHLARCVRAVLAAVPGPADPGAVRAARPTWPRSRDLRDAGRGGDRHPRRVARRRGPAPVDARQVVGADGRVRGGLGRGGAACSAATGSRPTC